MNNLEIAIIELINRIYCMTYCGYIKVKEVKDCDFCKSCCDPHKFEQIIGYQLILGLNVKDKPLTLAMNGTQELFLRYIAKELKDKKLHLTQYFKGYKFEPEDECNLQNLNC